VVLNTLLPEEVADAHVWEQYERLLPHVLSVTATCSSNEGNQDLIDVLRKTADYLQERAHYEHAEPLYQRALHVGEQHLGTEAPALAPVLAGLAFLQSRRGNFAQAEALGSRAARLSEQALGPIHPQVAASLSGDCVCVPEQVRPGRTPVCAGKHDLGAERRAGSSSSR
jgi:hypothetical protein